MTTETQLQLFDPDEQHTGVQFRLDRETRARNLAHIARIRRQLADATGPAPRRAA